MWPYKSGSPSSFRLIFRSERSEFSLKLPLVWLNCEGLTPRNSRFKLVHSADLAANAWSFSRISFRRSLMSSRLSSSCRLSRSVSCPVRFDLRWISRIRSGVTYLDVSKSDKIRTSDIDRALDHRSVSVSVNDAVCVLLLTNLGALAWQPASRVLTGAARGRPPLTCGLT